MNFYVFLWSEVFFVVTIWKKNNCEHQTEHTELGACVIFLLGGRSLNMVSVSMKKPNCSFRKRKNNVRAMFSVLNILCGYLLRIYFIFEKGRSSNIFSENVKNHLFLSDFVVVTVARNIYIYVWFGIGRSLIYFFLVTKDELYVFIPKMVDHRNPSKELCGIIYDLFLACIRVSQVPFNWIRDVMTACLNNEWFILAFFTSEAGRSVTLNYYFWFANRPLPSKNIIWFFKKRQHYSGLLFFFFFRGYWEWHLSWVQWPYLELTVNSSWLSFYISWKRQISKSLVRGFELIYSFIFVENPVILVHPATFELVEL